MQQNRQGVFGQGILRVGLYARVSTHDQQTLPLQQSAMREYSLRRGWTIVFQIDDIASGAGIVPFVTKFSSPPADGKLISFWSGGWIAGAILVVIVNSMQELHALGVGFVSLTESLDFTTPSGRAMVGMLAVFSEFEREILRDRVKAGIAEARKQGKPHGRPATARNHMIVVRELFSQGISKRRIARESGSVGRPSVACWPNWFGIPEFTRFREMKFPLPRNDDLGLLSYVISEHSGRKTSPLKAPRRSATG